MDGSAHKLSNCCCSWLLVHYSTYT